MKYPFKMAKKSKSFSIIFLWQNRRKYIFNIPVEFHINNSKKVSFIILYIYHIISPGITVLKGSIDYKAFLESLFNDYMFFKTPYLNILVVYCALNRN